MCLLELLGLVHVFLEALLPLQHVLLELLVVLEDFCDCLHVGLAELGSVIILLHLLFDVEGVLPVLVLHEEAKVNDDEGGGSDNTAGAVDENALLLVLDHFIELERSLEKLIVNHGIVAVINWIVNDFRNAVRAIELLELTLVDAPCVLLLQSLDVEDCIDAMLLQDLDVRIVKRIRTNEYLLSICLLDEERIQEVGIALVTDRVDDENSIGIHLMAATLLCKLALVVTWIDDLKSTHRLPLFLEPTAHSLTSNEVVLNFVGVILPLTAIVTLGIVEDELTLPWYDLLAVLVIEPAILSGNLVHLDGCGNPVLRVLVRDNFNEGLIAVVVGWQINREFDDELLPNIIELEILDLLVGLVESLQFHVEVIACLLVRT